MTILKLYKCIKSNDDKRFAIGEIYPLYNNGGKNYIVANNNVNWYENEFPFIELNYGVEFDEVKEKKLINNQQKTTEELKAEITYWKETAKFWKSKANYRKETAKFWKEKN